MALNTCRAWLISSRERSPRTITRSVSCAKRSRNRWRSSSDAACTWA
ncbi:hypothetical protein DVA67_005390 [Solirubrobacter sp. CPCC 204708]|nr:hypothetical protein [Solirubrobacter deserti]